MRPIHSLPIAAAILLAACGGGAEDAAADGEVTADELAAAVDDVPQPRPGQYRTELELIAFDIPGMPEQAKQQMQAIAGSELTKGNQFCLTPEDVASNGPRQMMENMAESDCTFSKFEAAGGTIDAAMQCAGEGGMKSEVKMAGSMTPESSDMTMEMEQEMPGAGAVHMKMRVKSQRIGECA